MSDSRLLEPTFLFRFHVNLRKHSLRWGKTGLKLPEETRVPAFTALDGGPNFGDVRLAWSSKGLGFWVRTQGKKKLPWCNPDRAAESDGLQLYIDTRDSGEIHRGNRYCHKFVFSPFGGGTKRDQPMAGHYGVHQARESPPFAPVECFKIYSAPLADGYLLSGLIPAQALTGYDPSEYQQVRFCYFLTDSELGWQVCTSPNSFPVSSDPTMWVRATLAE